ncbi:hypothetical protein BGX26_000844 [Mortierella sp. AD094]|nr:hypothetical protein BGX26_000844 [Mortierella sp. AD094]
MDPHPIRPHQYQHLNKTRNKGNHSISTVGSNITAPSSKSARSTAVAYYRDRQPNSHQSKVTFTGRRLSSDGSLSTLSLTPFSASAPASASISPVMSSSSSPRLTPSRKNSAVYENAPAINLANVGATLSSTSISTNSSEPSDLVQHCLLFPTYATRYSRSDTKDPLDWNIRIRGWAFSKRSNRRRRIVMSVARKIAGVTKDNKVYETLESRFGMFLNSNTQGAQFAVQCVGIASTTHMELAGDAESDDPIEEVLMDELSSSDRALDETEVAQDKARLRDSLKQNGGEFLNALASDSGSAASRLQHAAAIALKLVATGRNSRVTDGRSLNQKSQQEYASHIEQLRSPLLSESEEDGDNYDNAYDGGYDEDNDNTGLGLSFDSADEEPKYTSDCEIPLSKLATPDNESSWRIGKGLLRSAFRRSKQPYAVASSYESMDPRKHPQTFSCSRVNLTMTNVSSCGSAKPPLGMNRAESDASVLTQMSTQYENLGEGSFPTIHTSSRPGGHFTGTLRMSNGEVETLRKQAGSDEGGVIGSHPKFLKLHAHHQDMATPAHGIVNLIDPEGVSIISDIDDTIKETNVTGGARTVLRNTFLREMREVDGMANVYRKWWEKGAAVHYVSNSPWQLIPTLLEFFHTHMFPPGSAHLKVYDNNVLKTYFMAPGENKRRSIREILEDFPDRKFILVGDSGEIDLEMIFIRDITTARLKEMASKAHPARGRSFSALKAPISAVTTGFGFFGRRGSNSATNLQEIMNVSTPALPNMSLGSEDATEVSSPYEMPEEESRKKDESSDHGKIDSFSPKLQPSGPSSLAPESAASRSGSSTPAISPRLQAKQFSASVKNATSLLSSAFGRSSSNSSKRNGGRSPGVSPLASEIGSNEYPFPRAGSSNTGSWVSQQSGSNDANSNISDDHEDSEDYGSHSPYLNGSVSRLNLTEEMFEGQQQAIAKHKQHQIKQRPSRTNTFSFSFSSPSSFGSTPAGTPSGSKGSTPLHSPSMSPRMPAQPIRGQTGGIGGSNGFSSTTATLSNSISTGSVATITTITATSTTVFSSSASLSSSSPGPGIDVPTSPSFSIIRSPLEVWQDRVIQCRKRLPKGVTLTLFESADELERCQIVQGMFTKFENAGQDKKKNGGARDEAANESSGQLSASDSTTSVTTSESEASEDSMTSVEFIDRSFDAQLEVRSCQVSA